MTNTNFIEAFGRKAVDRSSAEVLRSQASRLLEEAERHEAEVEVLKGRVAALNALAMICRNRAGEYEVAAAKLEAAG